MVVISYDADVPVAAGQEPDEFELRLVDVLVLVHKHVLELRLVEFADVRALVEQADGVEDQVVEVERPVRLQLLLVERVDARDDRVESVREGRRVVLRQDHLLLRVADLVEDRLRRIHLLVNIQLFEALATTALWSLSS